MHHQYYGASINSLQQYNPFHLKWHLSKLLVRLKAEARRSLFLLTREKRRLFLLTSEKKPLSFSVELLKQLGKIPFQMS